MLDVKVKEFLGSGDYFQYNNDIAEKRVLDYETFDC